MIQLITSISQGIKAGKTSLININRPYQILKGFLILFSRNIFTPERVKCIIVRRKNLQGLFYFIKAFIAIVKISKTLLIELSCLFRYLLNKYDIGYAGGTAIEFAFIVFQINIQIL